MEIILFGGKMNAGKGTSIYKFNYKGNCDIRVI